MPVASVLKRPWLVGATTLIVALGALPAGAAETYTYQVRHPFYGDIGVYTDSVERNGTTMHLDGTLHVLVRFFGIVLHREDAHTTQVWQDGRLVRFDGITTTNGSAAEVHGTAQADGFHITRPTGPITAPADVIPSSPWFARAGSGMMMSTKTGKLDPVYGTDQGAAVITVEGREVAVRRFELMSDKRQEVWLTAKGVPVRFRSYEGSTAIDFELVSDTAHVLESAGK
jgi:hypothetical protein